MDLTTNLSKTPEGYNTIITCIDYTSKFIESKPLIGKCAEGGTQFMYELVCHYGAARIHISDQGREFVNQVCVHSCAFKINTCISYNVQLRIVFHYLMYTQGKGKGKVRKTAIPPNQLKRYLARSQNIPAKSDDEYASESDGGDDQGPPIGTNSPVLSDADTILYADSEDDKGIPGVPIPGYTSSGDSDDTIEIDVVGEIPGHTAHGHTMEVAEILVTLTAGGDPDWLSDLTVPEEPEESPV